MPSVVRISVDTPGPPSIGTGIVYDTEGKVITNWHVVADAISIAVTLPDGTETQAELFRGDIASDLALIALDDFDGLTPPSFGDAASLAIGDDVVAIGYALALTGPPSVSKGVVSGLNRTLQGTELTGLVQTDAAINNGNSGGPLVNTRGEVIGITTVKLDVGDRLGFAININSALATAAELVAQGQVPPPGFLGITGRTMFQAEALNLGLPVIGAFVVQSVELGSPAEDAGMVPGDVIVQINQSPIRSENDLTQFLQANHAGRSVRIFFWRLVQGSGWHDIAVDAILEARP